MKLNGEMQRQAKALADKSRFRILEFIAASDVPVGVPELTELLGFNHNAIRQHLAILVEAGVITEFTEQRTTRGRPRKQYRLRSDALNSFRAVHGSYERLAELLLDVTGSGEAPFEVGRRAGAEAIEATGEPVQGLVRQLAIDGFEPTRDDRTITLHHCPFAQVASKNQGIVCELHRGLIAGHLASAGATADSSLEVRDPATAGCVVTIAVEMSDAS